MTQLEENTLMLVNTLEYYPGHTSEEIKEFADWLKNISIFGVETWLSNGIRKDYIRDKVNKDGKIIYFCTARGKKERDKQFGT